MKKRLFFLAALVLSAGLYNSSAQPGPGGGGPGESAFGGTMSRLFGENSNFSATVEIKTSGGDAGANMTMPGKIAYDQGKTRFEMDMTKMTGMAIPPEALAQIKAMGMDNMVTISIPEKKLNYMIYPNMKAYVTNATPDADSTPAKPDSFKLTNIKLGEETVDGHPCVKNKATVTDDKGASHDSTVWNATDLKNFPVKVEQTEGGTTTTITYKDVQLGKATPDKFEAPAGYKKYDDMMTLMQEKMAAPGAMPVPPRSGP